jgi:hypothetical protein
MKKLLRTLATIATIGLTSVLMAAPVAAQGYPQLQIDRIWNQGALKVGDTNVFRANVRNSSQIAPARGRIKVVLNILDPDQKKSTYEASILNLGPNGAQAVAFHNVKLSKPGAYIVTAIADPDAEFTRGTHYPTKSNERTETFTVGAPNDAGVYRLIVTVKQKGTGANGMRVAVKTADGQELAWRQTTLTGQAQFPRLAPSPHGKPYTIEVKRLANVLATKTFAMPAKDAQFEINLDAATRKN